MPVHMYTNAHGNTHTQTNNKYFKATNVFEFVLNVHFYLFAYLFIFETLSHYAAHTGY